MIMVKQDTIEALSRREYRSWDKRQGVDDRLWFIISVNIDISIVRCHTI